MTANFQGEPEFIGTNGIRVWILNASKLHVIQQHMGNMEKTGNVIKIASPRFATGDGVAAQASVTDSIATMDGLQKAGITVNTFPRIYADATDLTVTFTYTEPITNSSLKAFGLDGTNMIQIRTNLAVAARLQIPRESGAFLLSGDKKPTGIFIFTKPPTAKR